MMRRFIPRNPEKPTKKLNMVLPVVIASAAATFYLGTKFLNYPVNEPKLTPASIFEPQNIESILSNEKDPVVISAEELAPWRRSYLADGVITPEEMYKMADNLFWNNAYHFDVGDPNFVPIKGEYNIVKDSFRQCDEGLEADVYWKNTGRTYTFKVRYDLDGATLHEN